MLETRYPQLAFLLRMKEKKAVPQIKPLPELDLEEKELLYVFGIGHYKTLQTWLHEKEERKLVYLEDDLEALYHVEDAAFLQDPQVHIRVLMEGACLETFAEECAHTFPFDHMEVICLKKSKIFSELKLLLQRKTAVHHAIFQEHFYYPKLVANMVENFFAIPNAGYINHWENAFSHVPAIVCGAGPSLQKVLPQLVQMRDRALIIAGGTAITALTQAGITPHLGIAIDPNPEEYLHLKNHKAGDMPLIFGSRLQPKALKLFSGEKIYYRSFTGGPVEHWLEEQIGLKDLPLQKTAHKEALSVTTAALNIAAHLGSPEIILAGVDLAYTGGRRYPKGVLPDKELPEESLRVRDAKLWRKNRLGEDVETQLKWVMEADWIAAFAQNNNVRSCTSEGLPLQVPLIDLQPENYAKQKIDVAGQIETSRLDVDVKKPLEKLFASLERCKKHIEELDGPLYDVALLDLQEELAYPVCYASFVKALEKRFSTKEKKITYLKMAAEEFDKYRSILLNV